jgi:hypothetical protein
MFTMTLAQARVVVLPVDPATRGFARPREFGSNSQAGSVAGRHFCEGSTK